MTKQTAWIIVRDDGMFLIEDSLVFYNCFTNDLFSATRFEKELAENIINREKQLKNCKPVEIEISIRR